MSAFELIQKMPEQLSAYLSEFRAELRPTRFENLYMIKFDPTTDADHPSVNRLRGMIFNMTTGQIYSMGYPVPLEFKTLSSDEKEDIVSQIGQRKYKVHEAVDGTLIRLWYHTENQRWIISTNGVDDAHYAFWMNNVSFGEIFESTLFGQDGPVKNERMENLNPNLVHLFQVCHPLNVIVVNHKDARVYHVASYDRTTLQEVECDLGIERIPELELTIEQIREKTTQCSGDPILSAGYMVVQPSEDGTIMHRYRFENANYTRARQLRGDSNDIDFTLLTHWTKHPDQLVEFLRYYPIYQPNMVALMQNIEVLATYLFSAYGYRYKLRRDIYIPPCLHKFLCELHTQVYLFHLKKMGKTIQRIDVANFLRQQSPARIIGMIRQREQSSL